MHTLLTRCAALITAATCALVLAVAPAQAEVGLDGLHKQPWFETATFRDIAEDIEVAAEQGKRLAIVYEQRGCIYCRRFHEQVLVDPMVRDFITEHFVVVQYNLFGDEEVTDLDGESLTERTAAERWGVVFTPTILFMPETAPEDGTAREAAVAVMPGAFGKWTTLNMFRWVHERGYEGEEHFQKYHARRFLEAQEAGLVGQ